MQGSGPRHSQRALLGAALVQALALARILGCVWSTAGAAALRTGHPGYLVVDLKLKSAQTCMPPTVEASIQGQPEFH